MKIDTTGNPNIIIQDQEAASKAMKLARGSYQAGLLRGYYCLSGADLKGKANKYSGRYSRSRGALLNRIKESGIKVAEVTGTHNKRILVIG